MFPRKTGSGPLEAASYGRLCFWGRATSEVTAMKGKWTEGPAALVLAFVLASCATLGKPSVDEVKAKTVQLDQA